MVVMTPTTYIQLNTAVSVDKHFIFGHNVVLPKLYNRKIKLRNIFTTGFITEIKISEEITMKKTYVNVKKKETEDFLDFF